jgi:anti-sigma regulatory factor (Ser/Thr protein kinase)
MRRACRTEGAAMPAPLPPRRACRRAYVAEPSQVREARRFLAEVLDGHPAADDAVACLSELIANAVIHSASAHGGKVTVRAAVLHGGRLRVEVQDDGGPWRRADGVDGDSGRGLLIVGKLASAWGITEVSGGRVAWFEMAGIAAASPDGPIHAR